MAATNAVPLDAELTAAYSTDLRLTTDGRIVDFLDPSRSRPNTPEERVRQIFARKLHFDYGYPKEMMALEVPVQIGSHKAAADIVVFSSEVAAQVRDQTQMLIIVETKAPDERSGQKQLISYIYASSAEGGVWLNDKDAPKYYRRAPGTAQTLREWPNIPRYGDVWDGVGAHTKLALRPPHNLVETFRRCHNAMYRQGIDSEDIAMDMVRIILAKYQDEQGQGLDCEFRCTPLELQSTEGRRRVAERVRALFRTARANAPDVFDAAEEISAGDREIATVVAEIQEFRFVPDEETDEVYDVVGAAYEVYVGAHLKGDRGQYFTPRLITKLLTRIVSPNEQDVILDPAMGSGGFLIAAMRQISRAIYLSQRTNRAKRDAVRQMQKRLFGVDQSPKLVKVARMNMILASDGHAGLTKGDSLRPMTDLPADFRQKAGEGLPTVILTNPPFGATTEHRITPDNDPEVLGQFDLGRVWRQDSSGRLRPTPDFGNEGAPPEYLFVERCIRWLGAGGKLGIVLPRGVLDNDKALALRTFLLRETRVLAVINCHDDTFKPHTDAKAALIYCEKKAAPSSDDDDYPIFMAISQGIGHDGVGKPIFRTDSKGDPILRNEQPVLDEDTDEIAAAWFALRQGLPSPSEYYYLTSRNRLTHALNLNPVRYLPRFAESRRAALELGEREGWTVEHLGQLASVYNGPRFKRPYADKDVTSGPGIVRYFTGNAVTQTRGENIKYLDLNKAKPGQMKMIDKLFMSRDMILITDAGTVGRVIYATNYHDGAVGTNNLIRVVVPDPALRGYVYQFLLSEMGQNQLKANIYGAIVDHLEPDDVKQILVPIPSNPDTVDRIGLPVIQAIELQEAARELNDASHGLLGAILEGDEIAGLESEGSTLADGAEFYRLADQWVRERPTGADIHAMVMHPAYQRIIRMGERALPHLFAELRARPSHWFWALHSITGEDPVPAASQGIVMEMARAWLEWGAEHGYGTAIVDRERDTDPSRG
jgi:type I restriction enzyme M protein